jgi:hypothetical protein
MGAVDRSHGVGIALAEACAELPFLHEATLPPRATKLADRVEDAAVERALLDGWSRTDVAEALGVTRQAAHKKHARRLRGSGLRNGER